MVRERLLQHSDRRRPGSGSGRLSVALAAAVLVALTLVLVPASPAAAETTAEVESTVAGFYRPGATTVLLVTVAADQAVTGTIFVSNEDGAAATEHQIEVPGGSAKTFAVPVMIPPWGGRPTVRVETSDGQTSRPGVRMQQVGEIEPVAIMPSLQLPGLGERADLAVDLGQARLVPFDPSSLDYGSAALNAATAVAASEADIEELSESQRSALFGWVSSGGSLYLDGSLDDAERGVVGQAVTDSGGRFGAAADSAVSDGRAWLGSGTVYVVGDALSAGRYDGLIRPRFSQEFFEEFEFVDPGGVLSDLSFDAGFRTRAIGPFVAVLLVYIALVGPLLWLFLSRTRREPLLWLAVPLLAALVSLGIWGSGRFFRQGTSGSHVTVIGTAGLASHTTSDYMISSSGGGFTGVALEDEWGRSTNTFNPWDWRFREAGFAQPVLRGGQLGADVPPSGVVVARTASQAPVESGWDVALTVDGADITGTVTNTTSHNLANVSIYSGDRIERLDDVASGETVEFELNDVSLAPPWEDPVRQRLSREGGRGSVSSPSGLQHWLATSGQQARMGQITVVGWTREAAGPLKSVGGDTVDNGRTGYVSTYSVDSLDTSDTVGAASVRSRLVDIRWSEEFGGGGMVAVDRRGRFEGEVQTIIYDLPPGAETNNVLVIEVPRGVSALDIWADGAWVDAGIGLADDGDLVMQLPPGAIVDGSVYLRSLVEPPNRAPRIRSATPQEWQDALSVPDGTTDEGADSNADGSTDEGETEGDG